MRTKTIDPRPYLLLSFLSLALVICLAVAARGEEAAAVTGDEAPASAAPLTPPPAMPPIRAQEVLTEPLVIQPGRTPAGRFNARMIFLADQLERNVDRKSVDNTFIVTSFSNLNRLSETSGLGRLIGENLIHELQVRRWRVFEMRMAKDVMINDAGEISLSRNDNRIRNTFKLGGVVTGTYSMAGNDIIINARVVDVETGLVISSAQTHLPVNAFTEMLLFNQDMPQGMKIVGNR
jgi:TolB-like protein